nr:ribonuclease H-like domain-containing protein [Tanacetum cinerariifolium]
MLAQVGNQGNVGNQNGNVVSENVQENVKNVLVNGNRVGCSYKEFLACNPKEYDGKGVIINGDSLVPELPAVGTVVPLKTKAQKLAKKNELKAKSTLLLAIPDEHLLKFHLIKDAKSLWEAIKIRFEGNKESKKMHKTYEATI